MWRAPYRPRENDISQSYNDGLVDLYRQTDGAQSGRAPRPVLSKAGTLAFAEQRLGLQRYYAGKQNQVQVERVIRVPRGFPVTSQMAAVFRGTTTQYRVDLVQSVPDVYPPSYDLTLAKVAQVLPVEGDASHDVE